MEFTRQGKQGTRLAQEGRLGTCGICCRVVEDVRRFELYLS